MPTDAVKLGRPFDPLQQPGALAVPRILQQFCSVHTEFRTPPPTALLVCSQARLRLPPGASHLSCATQPGSGLPRALTALCSPILHVHTQHAKHTVLACRYSHRTHGVKLHIRTLEGAE